jgi:nickel transport protein
MWSDKYHMKYFGKLQFAIFILIFLFPSLALAHQMDVFATVEGKAIKGKANYHDGTPTKNGLVKAFDPSGEEIGRAKTDEEGKFSLEARFHCDYRLLVDSGDGHGGQYIIPAVALPADLPERGVSATSQAINSHGESEPRNSHEHQTEAENVNNLSDRAILEDIHGEVDLLQEKLNEYEQRIRFRDILGGIGFIVGFVGLAYGYYYRGLVQKYRQPGQ